MQILPATQATSIQALPHSWLRGLQPRLCPVQAWASSFCGHKTNTTGAKMRGKLVLLCAACNRSKSA